MSTPSGSQRRTDLLGRIQQDADRHKAEQTRAVQAVEEPDDARHLLAALRVGVQAIRTATEELRALLAEARQVTAELRRAQRRPC